MFIVNWLISNPNFIIWTITAMYAGQALIYGLAKMPWPALMVGAYAVANIGLIMGATK